MEITNNYSDYRKGYTNTAKEGNVITSTVELKTSKADVTKTEQIKTGYSNVNDYSKYLQGKYDYMNTGTTSMQGIPTTVSVSSAFLKKCMNDSEKAEKRAGKKQYQSLLSSDTAVISEEGRKALQNKMSAFAKTGTETEVRRLSSVSSLGYCNDYEKILSELSNGSVSDEFVTENYLQEQGNLNQLKLNLSISSSARTQINSIWDYYANQKH